MDWSGHKINLVKEWWSVALQSMTVKRNLLLLSNSTLHPTGYLEYAADHIQQFLRGCGVNEVLCGGEANCCIGVASGIVCPVCATEAGWVCCDCQKGFWVLGIHFLLHSHRRESISCCQQSSGNPREKKLPRSVPGHHIEDALRPSSLVEGTLSSC